jgi:formylglycine-generating enzyme required for sulfatase activity
MVVVGGYCIDSTEVTVKDYIKFLTAVQPTLDAGPGDAGAGSVPASCDTNPTYWQPTCDSLPGSCCPNSTGQSPLGCCPYPSIDGPSPTSTMDPYPIACVNWCDAYAYCTWAGKHLCGQIGGGALTFGPLLSNATYDEWYQACSMNGAKVYPYGDTFQPSTCAGVEYVNAMGLPADPQPVASLPGCVGGYKGIYDMSGNASEWENACGGNSATDQCAVRGGSTNNNDISDDAGAAAGPGLSCGASARDAGPNQYTIGGLGRLFAGYADVGFRCCADLQ